VEAAPALSVFLSSSMIILGFFALYGGAIPIHIIP
jgi:hypothetical protein